MKKSSVRLLVPLFVTFQLLSSCSSTQLISSWRDPQTTIDKTQLSKVLVMCLVKDETTRRVGEDVLVKRNPSLFVASYTQLPLSSLSDTTLVAKVIYGGGYDGFILMRLVDKKQATNYVPGSYPSYYGGWYGYYGHAAPYYYDPGHYETSEYYSVETNVYSLNPDKLIWSGITETVDPGSVQTTINEIAEAVSYQMKKEGFLVSPETKKK
jgi:hypothetical protein